MKLKITVLLTVAIVAAPNVWAQPRPGDGLLPGSELGRTNDKYPKQQEPFFGDDPVSKAFSYATTNTGDFLGKMWTQYGPRLAGEEAWQIYLRKAIESAKAGDWNKTVENCELSVANNENALDAKLLRALAFKKLNQQPKAQFDIQALMNTRRKAQEFLKGKNSQSPVADSVLNQASTSPNK